MTLRTFLDLSSGHLSAETWAWLDAQLADDRLRDPGNADAAQTAGGKTCYGWLVYAPEAVAEGLPEDLIGLLIAARRQGAEYVLLDCDAPLTADWPVRHPDFQDDLAAA